MAKQDFTAGQVLTAAQMDSLQANDYNWTVSTKTDSYTLVATDVGTRVVMNAATAKTITVNTGIFAAGDTVWIHNINTGTCTVTAGTATVNTAGSLALAQWEGGALYFTSASSAIFFRGGGANYGVATGGTSSSITVGGVNYTLLTFTSTTTLTVTKAGLFDVIVIGPGGSGFATGGGGGGGYLEQTIYLTANETVTIGAGVAATNDYASTNATSIGTEIVAIYGGKGGGSYGFTTNAFIVGGCGGGETTGATPSIAIQNGFKGGIVANSNSGGGGGLGAVGQNGQVGAGGNGGAGKDISAWLGQVGGTTLRGGGGGAHPSGTGGSGGGGNAGAAGAANTGGGGGGAATTGASGAGGSGIVYVRFKV